MSDPGKAVFLSYASQDVAAAKRIADALGAAGIEVWFDQSELRGGETWDRSIRRQIRECALFLPVISANTNARAEGYFRLEWRLADQRTHLMGRARAFLVPVCIDATDETDADVPDAFFAVHWTRLAGGETSPEFTGRLRHLLEPGAAGSPAPAAAARVRSGPPAPLREKSIAVLAFANLSQDADNEYFSDGISEELLNVLAKVPGLRVTARTSAFFFKGRNVPVPEIAQKLGVTYVVEGSVRKAGSRVRITAQLIDAADGFHLWSDSFDRELQDIFAVQDEIAGLIAQNLQLRLNAASHPGAVVNPEAYRLCLEGRQCAIMASDEALARAEALFEHALKLDPAFAPASAGLAYIWHMRARLNQVATRFVTADLARSELHARRALAADPGLGEPHVMLGSVALMRGELAEAKASLQLGLTLSPDHEAGLDINGFFLLRIGRPDLALVESEKAHRLNPFSWTALDSCGLALAALRRLPEALSALKRAEALVAAPVVKANQALTLARLGEKHAAIAKAREALDPAGKRGWPEGFTSLSDGLAAWALALAGAREEADLVVQRILAGPEPRRFIAGFALAVMGERERALALLADLHQFGIFCLFILLGETKELDGDPRCRELLGRLGATEAYETYTRLIRGPGVGS